MPRFHIAVHGRPAGEPSRTPTNYQGQTLNVLHWPNSPAPVPLPLTFEQAETALTQLPRVYFEPDGSFGWFSASESPRWDLGGLLYDRGDRVMYAELSGICPPRELLQLLSALGSDEEPLLVQLIEPALFVEPEEFCRFLEYAST